MFDSKKWIEDNKQKIADYYKQYGQRADIKAKNKERYEKNKERLAKRNRERFKARTEEEKKAIRQRAYIRDKEKNKTCPVYQKRKALEKLFLLRRPNDKLWLEVVGCVQEDFMNHVESLFQEGMTWCNRGNHGWHLDHIHPLRKGGTNHFSNLQPLWAEDNRKKAATTDRNCDIINVQAL